MFFLSVMILFIGLHSPVLGYCAADDEIFVGAHLVDPACGHECEHDAAPIDIPCEEEHDFVTVDPGEFQWSPLELLAPPVAMVPEDFEFVSRPLFVEEFALFLLIGNSDPPPPDVPIFRRDAALRL